MLGCALGWPWFACGKATTAAERFTEEKADRQARAEYATRLEREAYAEPERTLQPEASYEAEIEL